MKLGGKIALAIGAVALVGGGITAAVLLGGNDAAEAAGTTIPTTAQVITVEDTTAAETTTEATTDEETTTEATTEATTAAPTTITTAAQITDKPTTTAKQTTTAPAMPEVIKIFNTDTSMGWSEGPYEFTYAGGDLWPFSGPHTHALGAFLIPDGFDLVFGDEVIAAEGTITDEVGNGLALRKKP